jgi:hypothetical protein
MRGGRSFDVATAESEVEVEQERDRGLDLLVRDSG